MIRKIKLWLYKRKYRKCWSKHFRYSKHLEWNIRGLYDDETIKKFEYRARYYEDVGNIYFRKYQYLKGERI